MGNCMITRKGNIANYEEVLVRVKVPSYCNQTVILKTVGTPNYILNTNVIGTIESKYFKVNNSNTDIYFLEDCTVLYHFNGDDGFTGKTYKKGEHINFTGSQNMLVMYVLS